MAQRAAVLVHGHAHVVQEEQAVVRQLGARLQQVGRHAAAQVAQGGAYEQRQGRAPGGPRRRPADQQGGGRQQVCPDVDGLVVALEQTEGVAAPGLAHRPVPRQDVGLPEQEGHLGGGDWGPGAGPPGVRQEVSETPSHPGERHQREEG